MVIATLAVLVGQAVTSVAGFQAAVRSAKPGDTILVAPGIYAGGLHFEEVHGEPNRPITIGGADPANPPRFQDGIQFSRISHFVVRDIVVVEARANGINVDDGGAIDRPSHHVTLRNIRVSDLPKGNYDGLKLSGVDDFRVERCTIERWGGSAIDMVGCHRGTITGSSFRNGGDNGVQTKGGSSEITIEKCRFESSGQRGINIGGSTGMEFFRPAISKMPDSGRYEAKSIRVQGCTFIRGVAPIAFVGVDGADVRYNTIIEPERWAIRILQETHGAGFVPSRGGKFTSNLIVFSSSWAAGGVNIGPRTDPTSFGFAKNLWYCQDRPERSRPSLPSTEVSGILGIRPQFRNVAEGDYAVTGPLEALAVGAHAFSN